MAGIRPMEPGDYDRVDQIHAAAFELQGARGSPFFRGRVEHALRTDPDGAFVAVGFRGRVDGVAIATRRDGLWGLSLLAVDPGARLVRLERLRLTDGEPMAVEQSRLSADRFPGLEEHLEEAAAGGASLRNE